MKEYIERSAVMQKFADCVKRSNNSDFAPTPTWNEAVQIVEDAPAVDVVEVQDALAFSQTFNLDEYRGKEDQRDCDFVFGVLMRLGIVCLKMYDPTTRTMKLWVEKVDGGVNDG